MRIWISIVFASMLVLSGCASIVSNSTWPVDVTSTDPRADFIITNKAGKLVYTGKTPDSVNLQSGAGWFSGEKYTFTFKTKSGDKSIVLDSKINGWYFGNFIFGQWIGFLIVDPLTGAMWRLDNSVSIDNSNLKVMLLDNLPADKKGKLIRVL